MDIKTTVKWLQEKFATTLTFFPKLKKKEQRNMANI